MEKLFAPITDLVGSLHGMLLDAAQKIWSLVKPIFMIGIVFDLVSGRLGWIDQLLGTYNQLLAATSGASWLVVVVGALILLSVCRK